MQSRLNMSNVGVLSQRQEAIDLVARAIRSGVFNDLGSGSNVDVCVIKKDKTEMLRNYEMPVSPLSRIRSNALDPISCCFYYSILTDHGFSILPSQNERGEKSRQYKFRRGTTAWTKEDVRNLVVSEKVTPVAAPPPGSEMMDIS
jgi:20S proteasome subunit beta 2